MADPADLLAGHIRTLADDLCAKVALDVLSGIIVRTPVDTGTARNSWRLTTGDGFDTSEPTPGRSGSEALADGARNAQEIRAGDTVTIYSPLKYMRRLEEEWSEQAPTGMVAVTLASLSVDGLEFVKN